MKIKKMKTSKAYMLYTVDDPWCGYYIWRIVRTPKRAQEIMKEYEKLYPGDQLNCSEIEIEEE